MNNQKKTSLAVDLTFSPICQHQFCAKKSVFKPVIKFWPFGQPKVERTALDMDVEYAVCEDHVTDLTEEYIITESIWQTIMVSVTGAGVALPDRKTAEVEVQKIEKSEYKNALHN